MIDKLGKVLPYARHLAQRAYHKWLDPNRNRPASERYWIDRYAGGGNSGDGSYGQLAEFKAKVINEIVTQESIASVIEYGCGDGNQLLLANYPTYIGFDVSELAINTCKEKFASDDTKSFKAMASYAGEMADLTLSLDVIYHLLEDSVFEAYMRRLFDSATRYVIIYSSNTDEQPDGIASHCRLREFTRWTDANATGWRLAERIPNDFPFEGDTRSGSKSDFFVFEKI